MLRYSFDDVQQPVAYVKNIPGADANWAPTISGTWKIGYTNTELTFLSSAGGVPHRYCNFSVSVWGRPFAPKIELMRLCIKAAAGFGFFNDRLVKAWHKLDLAVDIGKPHVQLDGGVILGGQLGTLTTWADAGSELNDFVSMVFNGQQSRFPAGIPGVTDDPRTSLNPTGFQPAALGDINSSRGRPALFKLVHAAILDPCQTPPAPSERQNLRQAQGEYPNEIIVNDTF